ncbi:MAG: LytTR family DNA-binding domain-containing protein [Acidobacteriota bacterium]
MTDDAKIRAVIVDDEPLARRRLRSLLERDREIEIAGESAGGRETVRLIRDLQPDLLFLDVQMPEIDGFEVLQRASVERMPLVIFVTAYDTYALRAFDVCAVDYLVKPFSRARFHAALARAKDRLLKERADIGRLSLALLEELRSRSHVLDRLAIKSSGQVFFIRVEEIDWIEAEGKYIRLHCGKQSHLLREAISGIESRLDPRRFARIHRCVIVNIDRIERLESWFNNEYRVVMKTGDHLTLSRSYRKRLSELLGNLI